MIKYNKIIRYFEFNMGFTKKNFIDKKKRTRITTAVKKSEKKKQ